MFSICVRKMMTKSLTSNNKKKLIKTQLQVFLDQSPNKRLDNILIGKISKILLDAFPAILYTSQGK